MVFLRISPIKSSDENTKKKMSIIGLPKRYILVLMGFAGTLSFFAMRLNLSVALIAMVTQTSDVNVTNNECPQDELNLPRNETERVGEFSWDSTLQGYILGGYYYGYTALQIPGGILAQKIGGKLSFGLGLLAMSMCTILTPLAARFHVYALIAIRVMLGAAGGICHPGIHILIAKWAPINERSRMASIVFAANRLGPVISQSAAGVLVESTLFGGWSSVFYTYGIVAVITSMLWLYVVSESPATHPTISEPEKILILKDCDHTSKKSRTPWRAILSSPPFWALLISNVCSMWGLFTMFSYLPTYIEQVLHFSTKESGIISSLPYLVCWFFVMMAGVASDFLQYKGLSTRSVRKIMNSLGMIIPTGIMVAVGYTGCDVTLNIICLTLAIGFTGFTFSGFYINHIDIAPKYSGVVFGVSNAVTSITGFAAPYLVGLIMAEKQTQVEWRLVFFICAGVYIFGAIVFLLMAQGTPQPWSLNQLVTGKFVSEGLSIQNRPGDNVVQSKLSAEEKSIKVNIISHGKIQSRRLSEQNECNDGKLASTK